MFKSRSTHTARLPTLLPLLLLSPTAAALTLNIDDGSFNGISYDGSFMCLNVAPGFGCGDIGWVLSGNDGIKTGTSQPASGSHPGAPDGSENPGIDQPWSFFGNTGMHLTTSPVDILSQTTNSMTLDFSGWGFTWNSIDYIPLGTGAWVSGTQDGIAMVQCTLDCGHGDSYELNYSATVPEGDPSGWGGVNYFVHFEGTISTIPVPTAFWLFGSGLLLLASRLRGRTLQARP